MNSLPELSPTPADHFEGPEKTLEVDFVPGRGVGLRTFSKSKWDAILELAKCKILTKISNSILDAYVLSESSLFVYDYKFVLKTCGTTTLLNCLPLLLQIVRNEGQMELEWLGYSRKEFMKPEAQLGPHISFEEEVKFFSSKCAAPAPFHTQNLSGGAYVLGDLTKDHWYLYVSDYCDRPTIEAVDRNMNVMMYELDPLVLDTFKAKKGDPQKREEAGRRATIECGLDKILNDVSENPIIDDWLFEPCGYSMNAIKDESFYTVHVTPENEHSYASFETNHRLKDYTALLEEILKIFRPTRFTVTMFADAAGLAETKVSPTSLARVLQYRRTTRAATSFKTDYVCEVASYKL